MRKFMPLLLITAIVITSCSTGETPLDKEDALNAVEDSREVSETEDTESYVNIADQHIVGITCNTSINIPYRQDAHTTANIYSVRGLNPPSLLEDPDLSNLVGNMNSYNGIHNWSITYFSDTENDDIDALFQPQQLARAYQKVEDESIYSSFREFLLINRIDNIDFIDPDDSCYDIVNVFGMNPDNYGSAIYCQYHSPTGDIYPKYNILQQIDGISIVDSLLIPEHLQFVSWDEYIGFAGNPGDWGYTIPCVNESGQTCLIDTHIYEILDVVEQKLAIKPLEECVNEFIRGQNDSSGNASSAHPDEVNTWIYQAELMYLPVNLIDASEVQLSDEYYLFPCWILFSTRIINGPDYPMEADEIIALNAITGEDIDVEDSLFEEYIE